MPTETSTQLLDRIWQQYATPAAWVFTSKGLKFGDLCMAMTLMGAFRRRIVPGSRIIMLAISEGHRAILRLFPGIFDEIHMVPQLADVTREDFHLWCRHRAVDRFGAGNMLYLHPSYYTHGPFDLMVAPTNPPLTFIDLCKIGLRLPSETSLGLPTVSATQRAEAALLAGASGILIGRSVVLFPYAQSSPQDMHAHFARLAAAVKAAGMIVVTSVAGTERPIDGTMPVHVPFDLLAAFCELAGAAVVVRSGIADIIAAADCRKIVLYKTAPEVRNYSIIDMGTAQSADEMVIEAAEVSPDALVDRVLPLLVEPRPATKQLADIPSFVRAYFGQIDTWDGKVAIGGADLYQVRHLRATRGLVLGEGWADLEPWGVWSLGERASLFVKNPFPAGPPRRSGLTGDIELELTTRGAVSRAQPEVRVKVALGPAALRTTFQVDTRSQRLLLGVPGELARAPAWRLDIQLDNPKSPFELTDGGSPDQRTLGIGIEAVSIRPRRAAPAEETEKRD